MNHEELQDLINIEFGYIELTNQSIMELNAIIGGGQPDKFQLAAISKLLSDIYNGTENILKRICKYLSIPLPIGGFYHTELFLMFCNPPKHACPILFDESIYPDYKALQKFRHYVIHGYAFHLEWNIICESVQKVDQMTNIFKKNVISYIEAIE